MAAAFAPGRATPGERIAFTSRDGLRIEGNLWRPQGASGRRGGKRVPTIVYPHGGPVSQSLRTWLPFKQLLVREGFAFLDIDFRGHRATATSSASPIAGSGATPTSTT